MILEAATGFKLSKDVKNVNYWWDAECRRAIQEKIEERRKFKIRKTRTNLDMCQQKKNKN